MSKDVRDAVLWLVFWLCLVGIDAYTGSSAGKTVVKWVVVFFMTYKVIVWEIASVREDGWRGLLPVRAVENAYMLGKFLFYGAYAALCFAALVVLNRLASVEEAKDGWVDDIRNTPLEERDSFFWFFKVLAYKAYVRWDHEEAKKAVDYHKGLTRRRREWNTEVMGEK